MCSSVTMKQPLGIFRACCLLAKKRPGRWPETQPMAGETGLPISKVRPRTWDRYRAILLSLLRRKLTAACPHVHTSYLTAVEGQDCMQQSSLKRRRCVYVQNNTTEMYDVLEGRDVNGFQLIEAPRQARAFSFCHQRSGRAYDMYRDKTR